MIEDELRSLLTERAGGLPDNPARAAEVHSRITGIRRRRAAGAALALVLLALAGLLVSRLPSPNESLPPGVPAPPWFTDEGVTRPLPGFVFVRGSHPPVAGPTGLLYTVDPAASFDYLLLTWCEKPGRLVARNRENGTEVSVDCDRPVGRHREGALLLAPEQAEPLGEPGADVENVALSFGSTGRWTVSVARSTLPTRLAARPRGTALAEGPGHPGGTTVDMTVPARVPGPDVGPDYGFAFNAECVAGVELTLSVPGGQLGTISCRPDGAEPMLAVPASRLAALGLHRGGRVPLTIRSVGRDTDQWRVFPPQ